MWTNNPAKIPPEYSELTLCRTFGWTLSELDDADAERVQVLLAMIGAEEKVKARRQEADAKAARHRRGRKGGRG